MEAWCMLETVRGIADIIANALAANRTNVDPFLVARLNGAFPLSGFTSHLPTHSSALELMKKKGKNGLKQTREEGVPNKKKNMGRRCCNFISWLPARDPSLAQ